MENARETTERERDNQGWGAQIGVRESIATTTAIAMQGCDDPSGIGTPYLLAARVRSSDSASAHIRAAPSNQ